jgi:hypothetical protein
MPACPYCAFTLSIALLYLKSRLGDRIIPPSSDKKPDQLVPIDSAITSPRNVPSNRARKIKKYYHTSPASVTDRFCVTKSTQFHAPSKHISTVCQQYNASWRPGGRMTLLAEFIKPTFLLHRLSFLQILLTSVRLMGPETEN